MSSHWQEVALGDICQIQIGGTPSRSEDAYWWKSNEDGERLPWVSISDLQERVITNTKEGITRLGLERSNAKRVPPRDSIDELQTNNWQISVCG